MKNVIFEESIGRLDKLEHSKAEAEANFKELSRQAAELRASLEQTHGKEAVDTALRQYHDAIFNL